MQTNLLKLVGEKCGECKRIVTRIFERCEDCNLVLCKQCKKQDGEKAYCSSCFNDR